MTDSKNLPGTHFTDTETGIDLDRATIVQAVDSALESLRAIDQALAAMKRRSLPESLDLATVSAMLGSFVSTGIVEAKPGEWVLSPRNQHPDLVRPGQREQIIRRLVARQARMILGNLAKTQRGVRRLDREFQQRLPPLPHVDGVEIKVALGAHLPKAHDAKANDYIIVRYVIDRGGKRSGGVKNAIQVWEILTGALKASHFNDKSDTEGDAGKTATLKAETLKGMACLYRDTSLQPKAAELLEEMVPEDHRVRLPDDKVMQAASAKQFLELLEAPEFAELKAYYKSPEFALRSQRRRGSAKKTKK